ncbi:MAG: DUF4388 domain-containing protein [Acidimicrobiales bacterium]|nr:DUF4388 domain-containing protein [Acidimicrobiales bacterium]
MTLNGTLEDFSPAGILKVLSDDGRTGAVRFAGSRGCTVYLHRGQLYFARNERTDEALATALVRPGRLSADDWGRAIDDAGDRPTVGELLVRNGSIHADLLASVVLSVIYDPLIDLFREGTGEFDFDPDTVHWLGPFRAFPVDAIVNEVRKRVREVDEWSHRIPSLDCWVEASRTLPGNAAQVTILREDWELVTALSGPRTIADLAIELGRGGYSTARVVHRLHQAGLVDVVSSDAEATVVPIRREPVEETVLAEDDAMLHMGLPHRTARPEPEERTAAPETGEGADVGSTPSADAFAASIAPLDTAPGTVSGEAADTAAINGGAPELEHAAPVVGEAATSLDEARPTDPNAAWLADLYSQFIDEPETSGNGSKKRRRGEPNPVDVAFKAKEQEGDEKVSTLRRLMGALRKL